MIILFLYLSAGIGSAVFLSRMLEGVPELDVKDFISQETSRIYDANGDLIQEVGAYLRDNTIYDSLPESLIDAFLSIEDSRYFKHNGFDIPRFTKIIIEALRYRTLGSGGSTFTMQLVKNTYFSVENGDESTERERTIAYKVQQIWLSMKLERVLDKKEILTLYLNKLNFGKNIRGVQRAARYYFSKDCTQLNIAESALLAGIVNLPNLYNPYEYLEHASARRDKVLEMMHYHGYINDEEYELALSVKVEDLLAGEYNYTLGENNHQAYVDAVLNEVVKLTGRDPMYTGMNIHTAMIPEIQDTIEAIQNGEMGVKFPNELMQTAIVSMNNQTGEVVGIGGGRNYIGARLLNRATDVYKQPGSSVKPVLSYALAFEYLGYSFDEVLMDRPVTLPSESRVLVNASRSYRGDVTLKDAVASSLNIPAVLTFEDVVAKLGQSRVIQYMWSLGFSQIQNDSLDYLYAIGGNEFTASVMEMAGAHGAMINLGVYNKPHTITRVYTTLGEVYEPLGLNQRVISSGSAYLADRLMRNNVEGGIFNYMQILEREYPVYAKTGTTDYGDAGLQYGIPLGAAKDKWMIASTSEYTNAVWVGWDKAEKGMNTYFSSEYSSLNIPGRICRDLLDAEEGISTGGILTGVMKPDDVETVSYVYGTYPHVSEAEGISDSLFISSSVSSEGLKNRGSVTLEEYTSGKISLKGILATVTEDEVIIQWNTITPPCYGSRDISLHDKYNDIVQYGACLTNYGSLGGDYTYTYHADIYDDGVLAASVDSEDAFYQGEFKGEGEIRVCGTVTSASGTSEEACFVALKRP